jgi:membrane protein
VKRVFHFAPYGLTWLRRVYAVLTDSVKAWIDHRGASKGAALAFYTLFSTTPILVLAIAVAGYFFGAEAAQGEIIAELQGTKMLCITFLSLCVGGTYVATRT